MRLMNILLSILMLTIAIGIFNANSDGPAWISELGPPELTDESLIVPIQGTAPLQHLEPRLEKQRQDVPMIVFVDMPNTRSRVNFGRIARLKMEELFPEGPDFPITQVVLSQLQLDPPVTRIVFYPKEAIEPVIVAEGNSLRFQFPLDASTEGQVNKPETRTPETKTPDNEASAMPLQKPEPLNPPQRTLQPEPQPPKSDSPATLIEIGTVRESEATRVRMLSDSPLTVQKMERLPGADTLSVYLSNTLVSEAVFDNLPVHPEGTVRQITLDAEEGPPPGCVVSIRLARWGFYEVVTTHDELDLIFESPPLDRRVTIRAENETLRTLLVTLFRQYGTNFIADEEVQLDEQVTFNLDNVPLKLALDEILASRGYGYKEIEDGILRILPLDKLEQSRQAEVALPQQAPKTQTVKVFNLAHLPVSKAKTALQDFLSPDGKIIEDERSRSVIFVDTEEHLAEVEPLLTQVIETLDQEVIPVEQTKELKPLPPPPPEPIRSVIHLDYADPQQISDALVPYLTPAGHIEPFTAPEAARGGGDNESDLGEAVGRGGYIVVTDVPESIAAIEKAVAELDVPIPQVEIQVHIIETDLSDEQETGVDWTAVDNKRDATFSVSKNGGQLKIGALTANEFSAILHALKTQSNTRLLSNPHITVMENKFAQFHSGEEVPFRKIVIQQGIEEIEVFFKSVGIVLNVMAQVKADDRINLLVNAEVSSVGERPPDGEPPILTRKASTQMLIPDGDTVAIGGLTNERTIESVSKVPVLGHIPVLGGLFSSRQYTKSLNEITIYLTPTIVQQ